MCFKLYYLVNSKLYLIKSLNVIKYWGLIVLICKTCRFCYCNQSDYKVNLVICYKIRENY